MAYSFGEETRTPVELRAFDTPQVLTRLANLRDVLERWSVHNVFLVVDRAAYRRGAPKAGHVVIATDPREPTRTVVKRAAEVTALDVTLLGDNPDHSTDSRTYGPVPYEAVLGRVVWRYWPLRR